MLHIKILKVFFTKLLYGSFGSFILANDYFWEKIRVGENEKIILWK